MRLLWVVPRYGTHIVGGAETHVRGLVLRATPADWSVEVATTCAVDMFTWEDVLDPGHASDDGVRIVRLPVTPRDPARFAELHAAVIREAVRYDEELEFLSNFCCSTELERFVETRASEFDLMIFSPYLFGTTMWGAQVAPERSALMPCLHDEAYAHFAMTRHVFEVVRGCLFNSLGEERLARRLYRVAGGGLVGLGFDIPAEPPRVKFADPRGLGEFVVYVGRLEEGKRVNVAVDYHVRYAAERPAAPQLVLVGRGPYEPPPEADGVVVHAGFVTVEDKRAVHAEALALVNPSELESLSLALMDSWVEGTPALVAAGSDVMREHCDRSGGGFVFDSYESYRDALDILLENPSLRARMGAAGREYVRDTYGWADVSARFRRVVEELAA